MPDRRPSLLRIGPLQVWPPVVLAPMAGVTNAAYRTLCRRYGAGLYVSQMLTARAIVEGHERTLEHAAFAPGEWPRSIQLYGTEPRSMSAAARWLAESEGVDHIDLNFGCPAKKVTRHGGGAALPWKRPLLRRIVRATVRAAGTVPVTVKFRMGIDDDHLTFLEAGRIAEDEGCAAVALHARTAHQLYSGRAQWHAIAELKAAVGSIPVLGNGDIWVASDAVDMMRATACDGVVVGRGCLGRPWLFRELAETFDRRPLTPAPDLGGVVDIMAEHLTLLAESMGEDRAVRDFRKHCSWYLKGFEVGPQLRRSLNQLTSIREFHHLVRTVDRSQPFPVAATTMARGHTNGPRDVTVPHGWLESPDLDVVLDPGADVLVSGG